MVVLAGGAIRCNIVILATKGAKTLWTRREHADELTETRDPVQSTPDSESTRVQSIDSTQSTGADTQLDIHGDAVVATPSVGSEAEATDQAGSSAPELTMEGGAVPTEAGEREVTR